MLFRETHNRFDLELTRGALSHVGWSADVTDASVASSLYFKMLHVSIQHVEEGKEQYLRTRDQNTDVHRYRSTREALTDHTQQ